MNKTGAAFFAALFLLTAILFPACSRIRKTYPAIDTGADDAAMRYGVLWAVIIEPYATFRESGSISAPARSYGRQCDVEQVTARSLSPNPADKAATELWYGFEKGWLPESSVLIFTNRYRAETAAARMRESLLRK
jgi:hypothetical protein